MDRISFPQQNIGIDVAVGRSPLAKAFGLSFRRSAVAGGMLFPTNDRRLSIWMMGMRFPLDIIWIADGRIVKIDHEVPPPRHWIMSALMPYFLPRYTCGERVSHVLETASGFCRAHGIDEGDAVVIGQGVLS